MPAPRFSTPRALRIACAAALLAAAVASAKEPPFSVVEATHSRRCRRRCAPGGVTSRELVEQYLVRIATYEDRLNAVIAVNPRALEEADALDRERRAGRVRGPLHGIPIALKDNIHTTDMPTTGGALAFRGPGAAVRGDADAATCARRARSSSPRRR